MVGLRQASLPAALLLAVAACAPAPPATVPAGPAPSGQARLWFYRNYEPSVSFNIANIDLNGARIASVPAYGPAIFRDVTPGQYHIIAEGLVNDEHQGADVNLLPGEERYFMIEDDPIALGDLTVYQRDVFYVRPVSPEVARAQIAAHPQ
jgi:hypothetical protein